MSRKFLYPTGLFMAGLFAFLFWPITSEEYKITFDQKMIEGKESFFKQEFSIPDSINRPNIIILMADDLGKGEVGLYGNTRVSTPNINRIGEEGVTFTEGYVTSPICSPSRAGLITGRYQQRFGFEFQPHDRYPHNWLERTAYKYILDTDGWVLSDQKTYPRQRDIDLQGLPPGEITFGELFQAHGYRTGVIGKWHLSLNSQGYPNQRGFDYHYGFYEAFSLYAYEEDTTVVHHHHDTLFIDPHIWGKQRDGSAAIRINDEEIMEEGYLTTRIGEEAVDFIDRNKEHPFLLYVPFNAPHTPFQAPKDQYDRYAHVEVEDQRVYYAMISAMDEAIGAVLDKVKEEGLEENTLIFFLADNGPATYTGGTDNKPLKGGKFSDFEGGLNVPFAMQWKGRVPAGKQSDHPVISLDIFTTAAAAAGITLPDDRVIDGVNLVPYLGDSAAGVPHEMLFWRAGYNKAVRKGDWKLIINDFQNLTMLFDLSKDKPESNNLAEEYPEIVGSLTSALNDWEEGLATPHWPRIMDYEYFMENGEVYYYTN